MAERPAPSTRREAARPARRRSIRLRLDPRWLDRIVRGRIWIPLLAIMLVGIVGMRVEVLKLGAQTGNATQLVGKLQSTNQLLRSQVSQLSSPSRITQIATGYGMVQIGPLDPHFVHPGGAKQLSQAIGAISPPDPTAFLAGLQAEKTANGDKLQAVLSPVSTPTTPSSTSTGAGTGSTAAGTTTSPGATTGTTGAGATGGTAAPGTTASTGTSATSTGTGATGTASTGTTGAPSTGTTGATNTTSPTSGAVGPASGGVGIGG